MRATIAELIEVRSRLKSSAEREEELTKTIKEYVDNQSASIKHNAQLLALIEEKPGRKRIDSVLLKTKYPEAADACEKPGLPYLQIKCFAEN